MTDEEVPEGEYRQVAIEIKHLFENMVVEADEKNEEFFLDADVEHALRRLLVDPVKPSLEYLLKVSPAMIDPVNTIIMGLTAKVALKWSGHRFDDQQE